MTYSTSTNSTASAESRQPAEATRPTHSTDESKLWLPPRQIRRYQRNKIIGGLIITVIFAGWLVLQWSNVVMRLVALGLIATTLWVVIESILDDLRRGHGRQIEIVGGRLLITDADKVTTVSFADVAAATWHDESMPGLYLYDGQGQTLAHLDSHFLADQAEARCFLGWSRQRAQLPFKVQWPS